MTDILHLKEDGLFTINNAILLLSIILVCISPVVGSFCIFGAFGIHIFRMLKYDIHTFMFDMSFLMPFANIYKVAPNTPSLVLILILLGLCWFTLRSIKSTKTGTPIVFITCAFLFVRSGFLMDALLSIICSLALVCMFARNANNLDVIKVAYGYIIAVALSVIVAYLAQSSNLYIDYISAEIQVDNFSEAVRFKGLFSDPNYLGTYLLSAIGILFQLLIIKRIHLISFICLFSIFAFGGIISYSKSFFLTFIAIFILALYNLWKSGNKKYTIIFFIIFLVAGVYAARGVFSDINIIVDRFRQGSSLDDLTTGRSTLWAKYYDNIFSNPFIFLFGNGLDAPLLIQGAHNLYLEILYYVGGIGLILIFFAYVSSFKSVLQDFSRYNVLYKGIASLTLIILFVIYWSLQGFFGFATYFQFFIALLMFRLPLLKNV